MLALRQGYLNYWPLLARIGTFLSYGVWLGS
jgi:hypothetical protein